MSEGTPSSSSASTQSPTARSDLGRRVTARRQELGLTREEVAERCGAAPSYIAYIEDRAAAPAVSVLVRLADALETTVAELTGMTVERPPGMAAARPGAELIALSESECFRLLATHGVGRIALVTADGPVIFPVNYVLAGKEIAFRTTSDGLLAASAGTEVAFEADHIDDAMSQGWSVLVVGDASGVMAAQAIQRLDSAARSLPWAGGPRTHWMVVTPTRITGRRVVQR
ncbi:helix-turn-helix domain-containing protein [Streptomyces atratus]|uniref:helix-turn-helix domain-containing protein n=1 Tax=Streptomyces atratus TaxID=1893 RepID=UPI0033ECF1F9